MSRTHLRTLALALVLPFGGATAQQAKRPEPIKDNSFLIEEAYNQEAGVVQHINTFAHPTRGREWSYSFTQEWPVGSIRHQLSATVPVQQTYDGVSTRRGVGDVALNYRYQLAGAEGGALAVAPRLSVLLASGSAREGTGAGGTALQVNLPVSIELSERLVTHLNGGATWTPSAHDAIGATAQTRSFNLGQSVIWLASQNVNLMLEAAWTSTESVTGSSTTEREQALLVSPGIRWAHNLAHGLQIVPGLAYPIGIGPSRGERSVFTYLSFEHPF